MLRISDAFPGKAPFRHAGSRRPRSGSTFHTRPYLECEHLKKRV